VRPPARAALVWIIGAAVTAAGACTHDKLAAAGAGAKKTIADSADQIIFGHKSIITDRGLMRAEVHSDTSFFLNDNTLVDMRVVQSYFYSSTGARNAVLTSRYGQYNTRSSMLTAHGDVVVKSLDGRVLTTPFLRFDQRTNQISSDSAFVLTQVGGQEVRGIGFVSDPDMNNVHIIHTVKVKAGAVTLPGT
jgi:LPS export ABC transporter protein LptC